MRKIFRRYIPHPDSLQQNRVLSLLGNTLLAPDLWQLNRRSAAAGVAIGLFCGLIPGPLQMAGAAIVCLVWRANLPIALVTTLYSNPLTIVPLYILAFAIGARLLGSDAQFLAPPLRGDLSFVDWCRQLVDWFIGLGQPLALGLVVLALGLAILGYFLVNMLWQWHIRRVLRQRQKRAGPSTE